MYLICDRSTFAYQFGRGSLEPLTNMKRGLGCKCTAVPGATSVYSG